MANIHAFFKDNVNKLNISYGRLSMHISPLLRPKIVVKSAASEPHILVFVRENV
jgi:hypothetical protein